MVTNVVTADDQLTTEADACQLVAEEYPAECGACAPQGLTASPPPPPFVAGAALEVVSYNLYWWNVGQNNRWQALYDVIEAQNFDMIGLQVWAVSK